jgi:CHAT domain-containing protein/Tfp pilus assembly protein PilF
MACRLSAIAALLLCSILSAMPLLADWQPWSKLLKQATEFYNQGNYADAAPLAEKAADEAIDEFGAESPEEALSLEWIAMIYEKQARYLEADKQFKLALQLYEKVKGPGDPDVARVLNEHANVYAELGRPTEAEPLYKRALALQEKALGPDHPDVAFSMNNIAVLYQEQGRFQDAEPLYQRSLAIRKKALGPDNTDVAESLNNLGLLYHAQGRYGEAEPLLKRALAIYEKALGPDHPSVATALNNLATLYAREGRYDEAETLYKRALSTKEKVFSPNHPNVAKAMSNLAGIYSVQGKYAQAEPLYQRSLEIFEKALGPQHPDVATALNNLAFLYDTQGRYGDAEPLFKRALAIREAAQGPEHPDVATSLNNLAGLYLAQREYEEAEPLYRRSLKIFEKALGPDHPSVALSLDNLATLYHGWEKPAKAAPFYDRTFGTLARQFEYYFTYMSEKERLAFLATVKDRFPAYFSFCLTYHQQIPELAGKMYDVILWQKSFIAQSAAALRAKIRASGDAESLRVLDELTAKKSELAKLAGAPPESDAQKQAARQQRIEQLEKEANELEKELVKRSGALSEEKRLARVTWQQVRDALKLDEAAVEIVRFQFHDGKKWTDSNYYVALIVTPQSQQPAFVVLGEQKNLEGAPLDDYDGLVAEPNPNVPQKAGQGRKFYAAFWQPLETALGSAKRVYFSPDGVLSQVSLSVVPRADGKLLMEAYDLRTVTSTKDLLRQPVKPAANAALLVGNPKFDMTEAEQHAAVQASPQQGTQVAKATEAPGGDSASTRGASLRSRDLRGGELKPLPGTQQEVQDVSELLRKQGWKVETDTQSQALEERVKAAHAPRVLHLATHGFFETDQQVKHTERDALQDQQKASGLEDPMLRSGVYLAGANRVLKGGAPPADMDDGVLTAFEATQLNLQGTELVVLSACETGLGKAQDGEGVFGLQRGLQEAGAQAVVMSMWSVPDEQTRELMTLFYQKWLAGTEKHEALRQAQQEMRAKTKSEDGRDQPFFWGAFVLVGR